MEIVNAVGGGELKKEFQLDALEEALPPELLSNLESAALYMSESEGGPTFTLFRSGQYSIAGAKSVTQLFNCNEKFLKMLSEITEWGIIPESEFEVRYLVGIGDVNIEINLVDLFDSLPVSQVEYEPEQFPGLFYRPSKDATITVFSTGKVSITGPKSRERLVKEFEELKNKISK